MIGGRVKMNELELFNFYDWGGWLKTFSLIVYGEFCLSGYLIKN